ncbi:restriction endonuclease subunit S [Lactobacillaceae bacterium KNUT 0156]|nr:restriction endonuclease subunit S [Weissella cibaria]
MSNKVPQIRFNGYSDAWEERKLGEVYNFQYGQFNNNPDNGGQYPIYGANGIIGGYDEYNSENAIVIGHMGAYAGHVLWAEGKHFVTYNGTMGIADKSILNSNFGYYLVVSVNVPKLTTGSGQPFVSYSDLNGIKILIPTIEEQQKIGSFFKQLDNTIALHQRKLDLLKEQKKGYLQKMFPKNGAKVPELRFAGFADDWEERKLGTIYDFGKGKGLPLDSFIYSSNNPAIAYGHLYTKYSEVISEVFWSSNDNGVLSKDNDLLFPGSSTVPNGTAQANAITLNNVKLGGDIIIGRPKEGVGVLSTFMSYQVNSQRQKLFPIIVGTTITHMYGKDISKLNFFITDYSEQEKIASFFKQLDDTIALHQRKLDLLKEQKKGFLQKMFV